MTDKLKSFLERHNDLSKKNTKHRGFDLNKIIN